MIIHSRSLPYYDLDNTLIIFNEWTGAKYRVDKTFFKDLTTEADKFRQDYTFSVEDRGILNISYQH